ncbi:MAG: AsnC family transcriptional regulator [Gammaproteobacteria bacterium]|nr:AsnC family transcriptional regulator [Gammaproteobacteria bacterium]MCW9029934.1 AsnC family transcriptional regulator [Gammaproteobacteria bacterium]
MADKVIIEPETEEKVILDDIDRKIVDITQSGLPLVSRPYNDIALRLGIEVSDVIARMKSMQDSGVIRRIAAVPNHYALGYKANGMTVWDVPDDRIHELGEKVGQLDFVSHCYQRPRFLPEWPYNLFAMVHAHDRAEASLLVKKIAELIGEDDRGHDILFSTQILKKTGLRFNQ